jgi:hypothetical protein
MAQRVCVVVDAAERVLLPDDSHRRACSGFSILHGKTGLPVHVNPGHDPGGHAKANARGGPAPARHRSSIRKRESATRGTWRFRVEGTVWRLRRPHFRPGGYCSLDFENPGARCRVPRYVGGSRSSDKSLTARLSRTLTGRAKQTHWWRKQASNCRSFRARTRRWSRSAAMAASSF